MNRRAAAKDASMNLFACMTVCSILPAPPRTGAAGCRVAWWGGVWWPTNTPARRSERRCPPVWTSAGSERNGRARPSPVSSGRSSSPGPASSPSGWNSALQDRGHTYVSLYVHLKYKKVFFPILRVCVPAGLINSFQIAQKFVSIKAIVIQNVYILRRRKKQQQYLVE